MPEPLPGWLDADAVARDLSNVARHQKTTV
jgi:hypothetical protein